MKDLIGWIGAFLVVIAYGFLIFDVYKSSDIAYNIINLVGGSCLAWRVWIDKNYSNFTLEIIFIGIAILGIIKSIYHV